MATVMELIGLSPMGTASVPQPDKRKEKIAYRCGQVIMDAVRNDLRPRDICTRKAFDNAIAGVALTAGIHQCRAAPARHGARGRSAAVHRRFRNGSARARPVFADLKPGGRFMAADVDKAGGIPVIAQRLLEGKFVDGSALTITGRTFAEEAAQANETPGQEVIRPLSNPLKPRGGIAILRGSLGPGRLRDQARRPR